MANAKKNSPVEKIALQCTECKQKNYTTRKNRRNIAGKLELRSKMFKKIGRYFKESFAEMKKVSWPGRTEVLQSAKIVIISTIAFALILGLVDFILLRGLYLIF